MCYFRAKMAHLSWTKFFWYKPFLLLSSTYWPFSLYKIYKKFLQQIQSYEDASFLSPKWSICPNFFLKLLIKFLSTYKPLPLCKMVKKFFLRIQSYVDVQFLGPKWPLHQMRILFRKPVNEPCFFHSGLSTCQKSKSDIYRLV